MTEELRKEIEEKAKEVAEGELKIVFPLHTIHVRKMPHYLYERMWNLRKHYQQQYEGEIQSWSDLLDKITEEFVQRIKEFDWI